MRMLVNIYTDEISSLRSLENQKGPNEQMTDHNGELDGLHAAKNSDVETFVEQQPEQCAVEADEQPAEQCAVGADEQPVETCAVPMLPEDIGLYVNWTNLELKERKRRKRILRQKMLPVPNRDGAFS